jgi:hypothetical protein
MFLRGRNTSEHTTKIFGSNSRRRADHRRVPIGARDDFGWRITTMASPATANEPTSEHVQEAVSAIEALHGELNSAKGAYMKQCKGIRDRVADEYESASNRGISKKLLKKKIKERDLLRKVDGLITDLEEDERSEYDMLSEKLGEFADTPLGAAALAAAKPESALRSMGL